ncbi:MAG TPA: ATP-binding protein [Candidatus Saccharimonadales bacterium]|nr:ATP-binding protein [Candidatus Saccharimonadales bacterium]
MDNLQRFVSQLRIRVLGVLLVNNIVLFADWWVMEKVIGASPERLFASMALVTVLSLTLLPWLSAKYLAQPTKLIWQAILHIAPDTANVPAPDLKKRTIGHDLVTNLVSHVYQLASVVDSIEKTQAMKPRDLSTDFVANSLPLPMLVLDKNRSVVFANHAMCDYIGRTSTELIGQNLYSVVDLSFTTNETFDKWLDEAKKTAAVETKTWERVRLRLPGDGAGNRQFDLITYFNAENPEGFESMLVFFDRTKDYSQDDQGLGFIAMAVHELRVPVTLLRGYIDAFEEDLDGKLNPELTDYLHKMNIAAEGLTAFINNILNVARVENDQLTLKLNEEQWPEIVKGVTSDFSLRAKIQGITIEAMVAKNLPTVGVDRISVHEVLSNLLDNAIKYSGGGKKIVIKSILNKEGLVETTVQDYGAGIPQSVLGNLFDKYYRSHRSRAQVGGTGLGLYLSKAIIDAHGGRIWVRSKEGEGSTFGFTIVPYAKLADEKKNGDNNDITRGAHGWIKNHSLYSR